MFWIVLLPLFAVATFLIAAYGVKPKHIGIGFTRIPPVVARVNAPSRDATDQQRAIQLPTGDTYVIPARSRGHFVVVFDWTVPVTVDGEKARLTVPKLSTTDFASIPRVLHSLISPLSNTVYAAILHDYLYSDPRDAFAAKLSRHAADRIFYWGMRARGVWRLTAGVMYLGVRAGGASSFKRSAVVAEPINSRTTNSKTIYSETMNSQTTNVEKMK